MEKVLNRIMIVGSLLAMAGGLCYGGYFEDDKTAFINYQDSFGGARFVEHCFKNGVNLVDEKTKVSLLHIAASKGWVDVVERLIANGADVNLQAKYGETPLYVAVHDEQIDVVRYLITKDANVDLVVSFKAGFRDSSPLFLAVNRGSFEIAETLLLAKPDLTAQFDLNNSDDRDVRLSFLGLAIRKGDVEMAALLVSSGADINNIGEEEGNQFIPLQFAIDSDNIEMVKFLISDANVNVKSIVKIQGLESTPLFHSISTELLHGKDSSEMRMKIMEMLILAGSDVNEKIERSGVIMTPLYLAIRVRNLEAAAILIKAGADVNQIITIKEDKVSLLEIANIYQFPEMLQLLIDSGARKGLKALILRDGKLVELEL